MLMKGRGHTQLSEKGSQRWITLSLVSASHSNITLMIIMMAVAEMMMTMIITNIFIMIVIIIKNSSFAWVLMSSNLGVLSLQQQQKLFNHNSSTFLLKTFQAIKVSLSSSLSSLPSSDTIIWSSSISAQSHNPSRQAQRCNSKGRPMQLCRNSQPHPV